MGSAMDLAWALFFLSHALTIFDQKTGWSMSLDKDAVKRIARLARLKISDDQVEPMRNELNNILTFVEQLKSVNTEGVEPMTSVVSMSLPLREDIVTDGGDAEPVLKNAPIREDGYFAVPKVVE